MTVEELVALGIDRLIISPGPGKPEDAGITMEAIAYFHNKIPVLGICLGHQALGMHYGARLVHAPNPRHGKTSAVELQKHWLFEGIENPMLAMRYHSLTLASDSLTNGLSAIAAATDDACIMAIAHDRDPIIGIQFHPESVLTVDGVQILKNWALQWTIDS